MWHACAAKRCNNYSVYMLMVLSIFIATQCIIMIAMHLSNRATVITSRDVHILELKVNCVLP